MYAASRELSLGVMGLAEVELPDKQRKRLIEAYAAQSVSLLRKAAEMGYFADEETVAFLDEDVYLEPLREREDFQDFLNELK